MATEAWNGYPPDPQTSGWHMLRHGDETAAYWNAVTQRWEQGGICCGGTCSPKFLTSGHFVDGVHYIGPLVVVADRDRLLVVAEAAEELNEVAMLRGDNALPHPADDPKLWTARMQEAWDVLDTALAALKEHADAQ